MVDAAASSAVASSMRAIASGYFPAPPDWIAVAATWSWASRWSVSSVAGTTPAVRRSQAGRSGSTEARAAAAAS